MSVKGNLTARPKSAVTIDQAAESRQRLSQPMLATNQIVAARLIGFSDGRPLLAIAGMEEATRAIAHSIPLNESDIGKDVAVMFDRGDHNSPIVIGQLDLRLGVKNKAASKTEIVAEHEIVFKCGKTCIKMTSDGTVSIRGANVISRASQTNRIRGGNVQIN